MPTIDPERPWEPLCMTEAEYRGWLDAAGALVASPTRPCEDCPWEWRRERLREGTCNERDR